MKLVVWKIEFLLPLACVCVVFQVLLEGLTPVHPSTGRSLCCGCPCDWTAPMFIAVYSLWTMSRSGLNLVVCWGIVVVGGLGLRRGCDCSQFDAFIWNMVSLGSGSSPRLVILRSECVQVFNHGWFWKKLGTLLWSWKSNRIFGVLTDCPFQTVRSGRPWDNKGVIWFWEVSNKRRFGRYLQSSCNLLRLECPKMSSWRFSSPYILGVWRSVVAGCLSSVQTFWMIEDRISLFSEAVLSGSYALRYVWTVAFLRKFFFIFCRCFLSSSFSLARMTSLVSFTEGISRISIALLCLLIGIICSWLIMEFITVSAFWLCLFTLLKLIVEHGWHRLIYGQFVTAIHSISKNED